MKSSAFQLMMPIFNHRSRLAAAWRIIAVLLLIGATDALADQPEAPPQQPWLTEVDTVEAYSQPFADLETKQREGFVDGAKSFGRRWTHGMATSGPWGLGPLANAQSCAECHAAKGRTPAVAEHNRLLSRVVRLSRLEVDEHGEALPDPIYGSQLNELAVLNVPQEGRAIVDYETRAVAFADGTSVSLRAPRLRIESLNYGPIGSSTRLSLLAPPPLHGVGLLEAIPDQMLRERAAQQQSLGLNGRANLVWDRERNGYAVGRFGHKASQPNLPQQVLTAFRDDIGITSLMFPRDTCTEAQLKCLEAARFRVLDPELTHDIFVDITLYLRAGAVPAQRSRAEPVVRHGAQLFDRIGCAACHQANQRTGAYAPFARLSEVEFHPYSDLLLHDLGAGLADGDYPGAAEWRTAPLWGLGLAATVNPGVELLHDGRARSIVEAILWHGGEAQPAREAFRTMSQADRSAMLAFLNSL